MELVAREEDEYGPRYGPALDLGTGSAVWGVRLAQRGWEVTGIDIVEKALHRADARVDEAGVEMRSCMGTSPRCGRPGSDRVSASCSTPGRSTASTRPSARRRDVSAVAAPDATVVLDCFAPRRRGPLPRGASRADVERAFPEWTITAVEIADTDPDPLARLFGFDERFYTLRRD
jgi:hypothetical protein